jgi:PKD repeat protein
MAIVISARNRNKIFRMSLTLLILSLGLLSPLNPFSVGTAHAGNFNGGFSPPGIRYVPTSPRINDTVTFNANWTGGSTVPVTYLYTWGFGDGSLNSTGSYTNTTGNFGKGSATHQFATAGSHTVGLTVSDAAGDRGTISTPVIVFGHLAGDFSFTPSTVNIGDKVLFTASVTNGTKTLKGTYNFTFNWDYGDGGTNLTKVSTTTLPASSSTYHIMRASETVTPTVLITDTFGDATTPPVAHQILVRGLLGIDCGYGSNETAQNATGYFGPDGTLSSGGAGLPTLDSSCSWAGSPDQFLFGGTQILPLVSDSPQFTSGSSCCTFKGGGFTAEVVYVQGGGAKINGFAITLTWNPSILYAVEFDQGGLPWFDGNSFTGTSTIDNSVGMAELSQSILSPPAPSGSLSGNVTLFRIRFDVIGIGTTSLTISNDEIIDANLTPNSVPHNTIQGSFTSSNIPDAIAATTLGYSVSWTFSPNPEIPGSPLTLVATATCTSCTGALTYSWDTDSIQGYPDPSAPAATIEATGQSTSITAPTSSLLAHRITLIVTDSSGHVAQATRRLPLASSVVVPPATLSVGTSGSFTAKWLGGIPPYTGTTGQVGVKWVFCNSNTGPTQLICSTPTSATTTTAAQISTIQNTYKFAGVFTGTVTVIDTTGAWLPPSSPTTATFQVNVTGSPRAFSIALTTDTAFSGTIVGTTAKFTATITYDSGYPALARSSQFNYTFFFGDGTSSSFVASGLTGSKTHTFNSAPTSPAIIVVQETSGNSLAKVKETGFLVPSANFTFSPGSIASGQAVSFVPSGFGGQPPYTFNWDFGDGAKTTGSSPTHTYSTSGNFTVTLTVTDYWGHTFASTQTLTVAPPSTPSNTSIYFYAELGGGIAAAVIAALVGLTIVRRRRGKSTSPTASGTTLAGKT